MKTQEVTIQYERDGQSPGNSFERVNIDAYLGPHQRPGGVEIPYPGGRSECRPKWGRHTVAGHGSDDIPIQFSRTITSEVSIEP